MDITHIDGRLEMVLIRHGQSTANASGVWQGQMEFPLSELGRGQAEEAGRALRGETLSGVYASPLSRAFETAEILARAAGYEGKVIPVAGLTERHGGLLQGHTWAEQEARDPEFAEKLLSVPEEERWALVGAETDEEILARFDEAVSVSLARHAPGERFVVVSHGGVMRAYLREYFGSGVLPGTTRAANASITRLLMDVNGKSPKLLELASTEHLSSKRTEPIRGAENL
jgi:probable phosphoglycerate mutase